MDKKRKAGRPVGTVKPKEHLYLDEGQLRVFFNQIKKAGDEKYLLIFNLVLQYAMRVSELCLTRLDDISLGEKMTITIQGLKHGHKRTYGHVHPELAKQLRKWIQGRDDKNPYLFPSKSVDDNKPLNPQSVKNRFKRYIQAAGLSMKFSVHNLRASRAVQMVKDKKYGIMELARWMRIKSVQNAQQYFDRVSYEETENKLNKDFGVHF